MGYCTPEPYDLFLRQVLILEKLLVDDGIILLKYWFSVSDDDQKERFKSGLKDPMRRWKLSKTDLLSITEWEGYSRAKDAMFAVTDIPEATRWTIESDDKKSARINTISHLPSQVPYKKVKPKSITLPRRPSAADYERPRMKRKDASGATELRRPGVAQCPLGSDWL